MSTLTVKVLESDLRCLEPLMPETLEVRKSWCWSHQCYSIPSPYSWTSSAGGEIGPSFRVLPGTCARVVPHRFPISAPGVEILPLA